MFCKTLFPETFFGPMTQLHDEIFNLTDSKEKFVAIAAPRGLGKTSIIRTKVAKQILYKDSFFIPYVSKSHDAALLQTENLKRDLTSNNLVKKLFGPVKPTSMPGEFQESFSKKSWVAYDSLVMPRGYGQQIRGLLFDNKRPDIFVIDDLEDDDLIENPEYRKAIKQWFHATLLKAVSQYSHNFRILYIDTLKHEDSLLQDLLDSPKWASVRLELCDDNNKSLVPELISDEKMQEDYDYHEAQGMLDVFYREVRNLPVAAKDAVFRKEYFKYYDPMEIAQNRNIEYVVIVDPAKTVKLHADDSAIVGIGIDTKNNKLYIADIHNGKFYPDELYDNMFNMMIRLNAKCLAIEETSLNEFIKQPVKNEITKRNLRIELVWLKARAGDKDQKGKLKRISCLAPFYRQGTIYHNPAVCGVLETQLMSFPRAKKLDVMDATAYVVELLDIGNRFFEPLYSEEEDQIEEDEYASLYDDCDDELQNWRVA
jgi:hypothetical protein